MTYKRCPERPLLVVEPVHHYRLAARKPALRELHAVSQSAAVLAERRDQVLDARVVRLAVVAAEATHLDLDRPLHRVAHQTSHF